MKEKEEVNVHLTEPKYTVLEQYKGTEDTIQFYLPIDIKEGESYLVFLEKQEKTYYRPTTRDNSIYKVGSDEYNEIIDYLER